ncbi:MAG: TIGR03936 family radical SAM-associated protein [Eubacterium sp.]|nr:TIGR03936 family radical SAM-associated protein [Eubacterium sp.]
MEQNERYKTRMRFTKTGAVRFIGHLDLMRFFQKAIRRAGLDVAYSQGYSPHQLMGFASPLGVGATTDGDYIDVEFVPGSAEPEELMRRLNECLTEEVFITGIQRMPAGFKNSMSMLETAAYMVTAKTEDAFPAAYRDRFEDFLRQDRILITKKTKKSEKEIDLKPAVLAHAYDRESFEKEIGESLPELHPVYEGESIFMKLPASSDNTVKPEMVMEAFFAYCDFAPEPWGYQVHRCQMWFAS